MLDKEAETQFSFKTIMGSVRGGGGGLPSRAPPFRVIGSLSKPRRRRQRERHQTKGLMSRTMAMHVRYKSLYIS